MTNISADEDVIVRVCQCGRIGNDGYAGARCGRDSRSNMRDTCPTVRMRVVAWAEVPTAELHEAAR